jgi:hypothetical protein
MRKRRLLKLRTYLDLEEALDFFADFALVPCHVGYRNYRARNRMVPTPYELDINVQRSEASVRVLKDIGKRETVLWLAGPVSEFQAQPATYQQVCPLIVKYVEEEHDDHTNYFLLVHGKQNEICRIARDRFSIYMPNERMKRKMSIELNQLKSVAEKQNPSSLFLET